MWHTDRGGWCAKKHAREVCDRSLSKRELREGTVSNGGDTSRSRRFVAKLLLGEAVTVVAVGGSITWGQGSTRGVHWHVPLDADLVIAEYNTSMMAQEGQTKSDTSVCCDSSWSTPTDRQYLSCCFTVGPTGHQ